MYRISDAALVMTRTMLMMIENDPGANDKQNPGNVPVPASDQNLEEALKRSK